MGLSTAQFMEDCKKFEDDPYLFTIYIHGWLIPTFEELRSQNKLKKGEKTITINGFECKYTGEVDQDNKACGKGSAVSENETSFKCVGTFFDDQAHGMSM